MTNVTRKITPAQQKALDWFDHQGGTGIFTKDGERVIAAGVDSTFLRSTWIALRDAKRITIDGNRLNSLSTRDAPAILRNPSEHGSPIYGGNMIKSLPGAE